MNQRLFLLFFSFLPLPKLLSQTAIPVETAHFTVSQGTQAVGRSEFSIQAAQGGYAISSHGTVTLPNTKYSFSLSGKLGRDLAVLSEDLNGIVNGAAVTFAVRPSAANLAISISANGRSYQNSLPAPARTIFLPDFDVAGYESMLGMLAAHPGAPVSALVPKQSGIIAVAMVAPQADAQATLNGAAITAHHASVTVNKVVSELYYSSDNRVLEVDVPGQTFTLLRDTFQLKPPPPPPADAAPSGQPPQSSGAPPQQ